MVLYTVHVTCQVIDGGATEADGGASAPVGPSVATPLATAHFFLCKYICHSCLERNSSSEHFHQFQLH